MLSLFLRATQIKTYSWDSAQVVLVGNKLDLEDDRQIPTQDGRRVARELGENTNVHQLLASVPLIGWTFLLLLSSLAGFQFFEASAKDNINVKQVFDKLVDVICEKMNESVNCPTSPSGSQKGDALKDTPITSQGGCAC